MVLSVLVILAQALVIMIFSGAVFDALHFMLHRWRFSRFAMLRWAAGLHQVHHDFLDKQMQLHPEFAGKNVWAHLVPEFLTMVAGTLPFFWVAPEAAAIVMLKHVGQLIYSVWEEGMDFSHMAMTRVDGRSPLFWGSANYHALHHVNPLAHYGSLTTLFDMVFGTAVALHGKHILIIGTGGTFSATMARLLTRAGAVVDMVAHEADKGAIARADIIVLAPATAASVPTIDFADVSHRGGLVPPEVWAMSSDADFSRHAARYARSPHLIYRHIAGHRAPGAIAAWLTLVLIRRGFRYVPATWTGQAIIDWCKFQSMKRRAA